MLIGGGAGNLPELVDEPPRRIVGIVGDVRGEGLASEPGPIMYVPQAQMPDALTGLVATLTPTTWIVRTQGARESRAPWRTPEALAMTVLPPMR